MNLENYKKISSSLDKNIKLVAVSKGQPIEKIHEIYQLGQRDFGENYLQELILILKKMTLRSTTSKTAQ